MGSKKKKTIHRHKMELLPRTMRKHLKELGFSTVDNYKRWCRQHGFSCGLDKDSRQRRNELGVIRTSKVSQIMANEKKGRNIKEIVPKIYNEELSSKNLRNPIAKEIAIAFERTDSREALRRLLLHIGENSNLLKDASYIGAFESIANHADDWIRPLETWSVKRHNRDYQFSHLLHHLFASYQVPPFMEQVWFADNKTHQHWYRHIGSGQNIRSAPDMPVSLTKKMAHHFLNAPKHYSIDDAIRWGQIHALGGDSRLVDALRGTRLIRDYSNDDFWVSVFRFFIDNPMLDVEHVHPIVDFIWNQKFENQQIFVERGVFEEIGPIQPNFSMKGRTPDTMLRQVNEWHRQLGREMKGGDFQWNRSPIGELRLQESLKDKKRTRFWFIRELLSTDELIDEGRALNHCVRSYAKSCYTGKISICQWRRKMMISDEKS